MINNTVKKPLNSQSTSMSLSPNQFYEPPKKKTGSPVGVLSPTYNPEQYRQSALTNFSKISPPSLFGMAGSTPATIQNPISGLMSPGSSPDLLKKTYASMQNPPQTVVQTPQRTENKITPSEFAATPIRTPSGLTITGDASTWGGVTPTQGVQPQPVRGLFPDIVTSLAGRGEQVNPMTEESYKRARALADTLRQSRQNQARAEAQQGLAPIPIGDSTGRQAITRQQYLSEQEALTGQLQAESALAGLGQTQQQLQQNALGTAAGFAAPQLAGYNQQGFNPITGEFTGGGNLSQAVGSIAEKVKNGTMSYDSGVQALSGYGQGGLNAFQQALGPSFNVQQSNAQAAAQEASTLQTGTVGGQLQKQAETVKSHMSSLRDAYSQLGAQYGIPMLNQGVNAIAGAFGSGPLASYEIALANVRDELSKILGGGTATEGSSARAREVLKDNMTPAQLAAAIKTATELMDSKIQEYTKVPGLTQSSNSGGSIYDF